MYQVIVVEDEVNVRRGICYIINNMIAQWEVAAAVGEAGGAEGFGAESCSKWC